MSRCMNRRSSVLLVVRRAAWFNCLVGWRPGWVGVGSERFGVSIIFFRDHTQLRRSVCWPQKGRTRARVGQHAVVTA